VIRQGCDTFDENLDVDPKTSCHPAYAGIGGARSAFYVYPKNGAALIVLTNLVGVDPESRSSTKLPTFSFQGSPPAPRRPKLERTPNLGSLR
jgi:hypothetical protein